MTAAVLTALSSLITAIAALVAVLLTQRGQNQTHEKVDTVAEAVYTSNGDPLGTIVEAISAKQDEVKHVLEAKEQT